MQTEKQGKNLKVFSYDFADFCKQLEQAVLDGYRLDFTTNAHYPFGMVGQYWAVLVPAADSNKKKEATQEVVVKVDATEAKKVVNDALEQVEATKKETEAPKRGRKASTE